MNIDSWISAVGSFREPILSVVGCMVKSRFIKVIGEENDKMFSIKPHELDLIQASIFGKECKKITEYLSYETQTVISIGATFIALFSIPIILRKLVSRNNPDRLILPAMGCVGAALTTGYFALDSVLNIWLCLTENPYFLTTLEKSSLGQRTCKVVAGIIKRHCSFGEPGSDLSRYLKQTALLQCIVCTTASVFFTSLSLYVVSKYVRRREAGRIEPPRHINRPASRGWRRVCVCPRWGTRIVQRPPINGSVNRGGISPNTESYWWSSI